MTVSREYQVYLEDMLAATGKALSFVSGLDEHSFASNEEKVFAVIHALEIIGEAAKHIPPLTTGAISRYSLAGDRGNPGQADPCVFRDP